MKVSDLFPSQIVRAGYKRGERRDLTVCVAKGFRKAFADGPVFPTLAEAMASEAVRGLKALEGTGDWRLVLIDAEDGYSWESYLYRGSFRVGSSADRLCLEEIA